MSYPASGIGLLQRSRSLSSLSSFFVQDYRTPDHAPPSPSQGRSTKQQKLKTEAPEEIILREEAHEPHPLTATPGCVWRACSFQDLPSPAMSVQDSEGVQNPGDDVSKMGDSEEDSERESSQEDMMAASWDDLSILERLGLNSMEMTEDEVELAFSQLTLAFRCDQYTLKKRLQAEEHARNLAEENVQLELERGRDILQSLKALCLDSKRSKIIQRLELCLSILGGTVERIANTAEVLGAVHQEARMSRAVELMVAHVDNLKRRHVRDHAELEETRKLIQRSNRNRQLSDPRDESEMRQKRTKSSQPHTTRRRISASVIPKLTKPQSSEFGSLEGTKASEESNGQQAEDRAPLGERPHVDQKQETGTTPETCPPAKPEPPTCSFEENVPLGPHSPLQGLLRLRRGKGRGGREVNTEEAAESEHEQNICDEFANDPCVPHANDPCALASEQRPLVSWLSHCHLVLFWLYAMTLSCVILLGIFLWRLRGPIWM